MNAFSSEQLPSAALQSVEYLNSNRSGLSRALFTSRTLVYSVLRWLRFGSDTAAFHLTLREALDEGPAVAWGPGIIILEHATAEKFLSMDDSNDDGVLPNLMPGLVVSHCLDRLAHGDKEVKQYRKNETRYVREVCLGLPGFPCVRRGFTRGTAGGSLAPCHGCHRPCAGGGCVLIEHARSTLTAPGGSLGPLTCPSAQALSVWRCVRATA